VKPRRDPDDDSHLDREFHQLIGIPHQSETQDDELVNGELRKLIEKGVIKPGDIFTTNSPGYDELHAMVGVPHRSGKDDILADSEIENLAKSGKIKQTDMDLMAAMETFDDLMNTAEFLHRGGSAESLTEHDVYQNMLEVVDSVKKAGEKVLKNRPLAIKLLKNAHFLLRNVDKAILEKSGFDESMKAHKSDDTNVSSSNEGKSSIIKGKRSLSEMDKKSTLQDMINQFYINKNTVKIPSGPENVLHASHGSGQIDKILGKSRGFRSAEAADEKLSRALDSVKSFDEAVARLEEVRYDSDDETPESREKRESNKIKPELKTRGFSEDQYSWLLNEFNLTRNDVDSVRFLSKDQFSALESSLNEKSREEEYTIDDLVKVLKSARQLVPAELEAAAHGALHMGYHLGGRVRVAADPVVKLVNNKVVPGAKKMWGSAVESIPDDMKDWAGDGRRIAAKRMQAIAEYAGPRLDKMGKSMARLQEKLSISAEETLKELVPRIVPALQVFVGELQDTLELAREVIPPMVQVVGEQATPYYTGARDTMSENLVKPVYNFLTSDTIAKPVGSAIDTVAPVGKAAYEKMAGGGRVVYDEVSPVLGNLASSSGEVIREKVLPVVVDARHQAGRVGQNMKTSVRNVFKSTLDTMFDGVPKMLQQVSHEVHDAAKVFRGRYSSALGKMRSREEQDEVEGPASVSPPVFRHTKAPKRTYVTSTEL